MMCQNKAELQYFLKYHPNIYSEQWLEIWTPYFQQGVNLATCKAIVKVRPLTACFTKKTTTASILLPRRYHTRRGGCNDSRPGKAKEQQKATRYYTKK
eukprot:14685249-Ditylum_brightwellii.AAC.1